MLLKDTKINLKNIKTDKYIDNYIMIAEQLGITNLGLSIKKINKLNLYRFKIKQSNKLFYLLHDLLTISFNRFSLRTKQVFRLLYDNKYRKYALKKTLKQIII